MPKVPKDPTKIAKSATDIALEIAKLIAEEKARSGKTTDEIFDETRKKLKSNEDALKADIERLEAKKKKESEGG